LELRSCRDTIKEGEPHYAPDKGDSQLEHS